PAPAQPAPAPCKPFNPATYFGVPSGDLTWNGSLASNAEFDIRGKLASEGKANGDSLPDKGVPVQITVTPSTVHIVKGPSQANCFNSPLVLQNSGPPVQQIKIHWETPAH